MEYIHKQKKYQPEMLADKSVLALINATNDVLSKELDNLSVKQDIPEDLVSTLKKNVFFFSGFKTHHELTEASRMLQSEDGGFKSFEKFYEDVKTIDKTYNRNYLKAEYNFATASTQMAVKWKEWEKSADRYDLQYRTAGDDHVREEHEALDGITLPMSDPFWNEYLPPMGWNCRCTAVRVRKGKYPTSDSDDAIQKGKNCTSKPKQQIFRFNPGKQEKIFPPKHPYFPKYSDCKGCSYSNLTWRADRKFCRICKNILDCYQEEESKKSKDLKKYTPEEKHEIYSKPIKEQFEKIYVSRGHTIKKHILKDEKSMDYERVFDAAKLYAYSDDVTLLPEIHKSEKEIRKRLGLTGNANPDLITKSYGFIDVKSPFNHKNILSNAIYASNQGAIACLTDDHIVISDSEMKSLSESILKNKNYSKKEVHWVVNGKLYKYNSHGIIRD